MRESRDDGPVVLSPTSARAVLGLAIASARRAGELTATAEVANWPGFRRRVRGRMAGWTVRELPADEEPPDTGPTVADEWAIYRRYRDSLRTLGAVDAEGFSVWASSALFDAPPPPLRSPGTVTLLELTPDEETPAWRRVLAYFEAKARSVRVTLTHQSDADRADVFAASGALRARLLARGYREETHSTDLLRPTGLREVEGRLFRPDSHETAGASDARGLSLLGAPQGEGLGAAVAREVRALLDGGVPPEDVVLLTRRWDEDAEAVFEGLQAWGLPVRAPRRPRRAATEPGVSVLRQALAVPVGGWEASGLIGLLRNGRFRPPWVRREGVAARAAAVLRDGKVFRGVAAIRKVFERDSEESARQGLGEALELVEWLTDELAVLTRPGTWSTHVGRLRRMATALGLDRAADGTRCPDDAQEGFLDALDDHAFVLDGLNLGDRVIDASAFAVEVDAIAAELLLERPPGPVGGIAFETVEGAAGARARVVFLLNLAEGAFPTRDAVQPVEGVDALELSPAFAREMNRFLRVVGSADERLVLAYPTRDEKGQEILPAGFLDDLTRSFTPGALAAVRRSASRFDPSLIDLPDLAGAPGDARVRAVALACARGDFTPLRRLAGDPSHRPALMGSAVALALGAERFGTREFTRFEGLLTDPAVAASVARSFGAEFAFSPSQLESYVWCPFQFLMRYVLRLNPVLDYDDLADDHTGRGDRVHKTLELIERLHADQGGDRLDHARAALRSMKGVEPALASETDPGRTRIEDERLERTVARYLDQATEYDRVQGGRPLIAKKLEVVFGGEEGSDSLPALTIGDGPGRVRIRGQIDRVDVFQNGDGPFLRVIDYKSGVGQSAKDVAEAVALQLVLYAMVVEAHLPEAAGATDHGVGYWELRTKGYRDVKQPDPGALREKVQARVEEAVGGVRSGVFVILPIKDECSRHCDYATVCRIAQVRNARKGEGAADPA